ncbi:hypothetical protein B0H13DRAFT_1865630 [Mycena leptocephala]|nr:hypothetical protein B0H13DRAFT_1865630 [Mycena leptocephala]
MTVPSSNGSASPNNTAAPQRQKRLSLRRVALIQSLNTTLQASYSSTPSRSSETPATMHRHIDQDVVREEKILGGVEAPGSVAVPSGECSDSSLPDDEECNESEEMEKSDPEGTRVPPGRVAFASVPTAGQQLVAYKSITFKCVIFLADWC